MWFPDLYKLPDWLMRRSLKRGDLKKAGKIAAFYARRRPKDPEAWFLLEAVLLADDSLDDLDKAVRDEALFREGLAKDPHNELLELALLSSLVWQSRNSPDRSAETAKEAREICRRHIEMHADSDLAAWPFLHLARLAADARDWDEAWDLVEKARRRLSFDEGQVAFWYLMTTLPYLPDGEERARSLAANFLERYPKWVELQAWLVASLVADGDARAEEEKDLLHQLWRESFGDLDEYVDKEREKILRAREWASAGAQPPPQG